LTSRLTRNNIREIASMEIANCLSISISTEILVENDKIICFYQKGRARKYRVWWSVTSGSGR